jgi:hypothetical protein
MTHNIFYSQFANISRNPAAGSTGVAYISGIGDKSEMWIWVIGSFLRSNIQKTYFKNARWINFLAAEDFLMGFS